MMRRYFTALPFSLLVTIAACGGSSGSDSGGPSGSGGASGSDGSSSNEDANVVGNDHNAQGGADSRANSDPDTKADDGSPGTSDAATETDGGVVMTGDGGLPGDGGLHGTGSCCAEQATPGCSNADLEVCVCEKDSTCCTVAWGPQCVLIVQQKYCQPGIRDCVCGTGTDQWGQTRCCDTDWSSTCDTVATLKCGAVQGCL